MPSRSETKIWRTLRKRKGRRRAGLLLLEGPRLVLEALVTATPTEVVLHTPEARRDDAVRDLLERALRDGRRVEEVSKGAIEEIADAETPQPVLAVAPIPGWRWSDVGPGLFVVLDGVQDPGNVGTLVRTAVALGASGIVAIGESADPWGPKAMRAAAGTSLRVPVLRAGWPEVASILQDRGAELWAASADGEPLEAGRSPPGALALGSEAHGVSEAVRAASARVVSVPMRAGTESLNVSAAGAILLDRLLGGR